MFFFLLKFEKFEKKFRLNLGVQSSVGQMSTWDPIINPIFLYVRYEIFVFMGPKLTKFWL